MNAPPLVAHETEGRGPAVVLLNGGLMSIRAWDSVAAQLSMNWRVVRLDFRGQLRSPGPAPATLAGHARDVVQVLDHLGIEQAHLVGTSFGALVALVAGEQFGSRVRSIVAMTATDRVTPGMWQAVAPIRLAALDAAGGGDGRRVLDLLIPTTFSEEYRSTQAGALLARREVVGSLPASWYEGLAELLAALEGFDVRPIASAISVPVLVVGAEHDSTFPLAHSRELASALPNGRLQILPGASHGVVVEQPGLVASAVAEFLADVDAGRAG